MNTLLPPSSAAPAGAADPVALLALAGMLQRLENEPRGLDPLQYRELARRLDAGLAALHAAAQADRPGHERAATALEALLQRFPVAATLHENRLYAQAGLVRAPLDAAVSAEQATRALLARCRAS
jgi:hypothetical protein